MIIIRKFLMFGWNQALSCIFPVIIFSSLALTKVVQIPWISRYDLILIICILTQIGMLAFKFETFDELKVICVFHLIGLGLEIYKVHMGSWVYPGEAWSKVLDVPLYSGFMYASVASYICQAWRRFDLKLTRWPRAAYSVIISTAIYANFFTHHFMVDLRWVLVAALLIVYIRTFVYFTVEEKTYRMPMALSFGLIAFFIWLAENISTFLGAWRYPDQEHVWTWVHLGKFTSWFLLVVISVIIVAQLKNLKENLGLEREGGRGGRDVELIKGQYNGGRDEHEKL